MNMSEAKNNSRSKQVGPTVPKGHVLGEFTNYQEATAMVDRLLQGDFKATDVSIVGHDPVLVERIRSRLGYGRVAASGALTGFWIGLISPCSLEPVLLLCQTAASHITLRSLPRCWLSAQALACCSTSFASASQKTAELLSRLSSRWQRGTR